MLLKKLKGFLIFVSYPCLLYSQMDAKQFTLDGKIKNKENQMIFLSYIGTGNKFTKDSARIINSKFSFSGVIPNPTKSDLYIKEQGVKAITSSEIWLESGKMKIKVGKNPITELKLTGSKTQKEYQRLKITKKTIEKKYQKQLDSLKGLKNMELIAGIRERLKPYFSEIEKSELAFFEKFPQSYVTVYMLQFYTSVLSLDTLKQLYDKLGDIQNSSYGQYLKEKIVKLDKGSPGKKASNFEASDITGTKVGLSAFNGSYVLLDFWASWCIPCRKEHPALIELYNSYKGKGIQFIGIADDDESKAAWIKAIEIDKLPWPQVLRGRETGSKNSIGKQDINELFGIESLPTLILIDRNGIIIGRFQENIDELKDALKKLF